MNVLFVCVHNRFRSRIAEFLFNKYSNNEDLKSKSAGLITGHPSSKFHDSVCLKNGIKLEDTTRGLSYELLRWSDLIILLDRGFSPEIIRKYNDYKGKEVLVWSIQDTEDHDSSKIERIIETIDGKIKSLLESLK